MRSGTARGPSVRCSAAPRHGTHHREAGRRREAPGTLRLRGDERVAKVAVACLGGFELTGAVPRGVVDVALAGAAVPRAMIADQPPVMLTACHEPPHVQSAISAGASGEPLKSADEGDPDDALPLLRSASVAAVSGATAQGATGPGTRGKEFTLPPLCAASEGKSLHAGVLIGARDRQGLRRLAGDLGLG